MSIFSKTKAKPEEIEDQQAARTDRTEDSDTVDTKLHYPPFWDISTKDRYILQFRHKRLAKLKQGQISITGLKFFEAGDGDIIVDAFIRNTVDQPVRIEAVDLVLYDEQNQLAAKGRFSLDELGELPPFTCTPWQFLFSAEDRVSDVIASDQWKIMFQLKTRSNKEVLDLDPDWEGRITAEQRTQLENMLTKLPPVGPKEVNISGVEIKFLENQSLQVVVLIRNGTAKNLQVSQLPLTVEDAAGDVVCQGQFQLSPLTVKSRGAKPWAFVYPANLILKKNPDLSRWKIFVKQNH